MFYCIVVGSRDFEDYKLLEKTLDKLLRNHKEITIVTGGAKGADTLAEKYAAVHGHKCIVMKADWPQYGNAAGIVRNEQMRAYIAKYENRGCVAFWNGRSRGTYSNFKLAEKYNNTLRIIRTDRKPVRSDLSR